MPDMPGVSDRTDIAVNVAGSKRYATLRAGLAQSHLPALDGMRAVAVFLVIFFHAGIRLPGGLGVLIFFVLSGFLITWLLLKEAERNGTVSLKNFYIRRCLRIFPAFYAYAAIYLTVALVVKSRIIWPQAWASLLYVNNYYQGLHGDPNTGFSHTWSLSIEEQFYLLWPGILLFCIKRRYDLGKILAWGIALVWAYRLILIFIFHVNQGYIYEAFGTRADSLMAGCLLAVLLRQRKLESFFRSLCDNTFLPLLTLGVLIISGFLEMKFGSSYRDIFGMGLDSLLVAILIVQMIAFRESVVGSWLNWRWMRWLGALSYSLYLYQQIAIHPAERLTARFPIILQLAVVVCTVLLCASASYYVVEQPILRLKEKMAS